MNFVFIGGHGQPGEELQAKRLPQAHLNPLAEGEWEKTIFDFKKINVGTLVGVRGRRGSFLPEQALLQVRHQDGEVDADAKHDIRQVLDDISLLFTFLRNLFLKGATLARACWIRTPGCWRGGSQRTK